MELAKSSKQVQHCKTCKECPGQSYERREFINKTAAIAAGLMLLPAASVLAGAENNVLKVPQAGKKNKKEKNDTKKIFLKKGACSSTFLYIINREFGHLKPAEEAAIATLAGGIIQKGHQCGMLWGASMAVGAEAYRRWGNSHESMSRTVAATQAYMESLTKRTNSVDCKDITNVDFYKAFAIIKMLLFHTRDCFRLAEDWTAPSIEIAHTSLDEKNEVPQKALSCASEMAKMMGATDEEAMMVSGWAGGMGLQGKGCGAFATVVWMKSLEWAREHPDKEFVPYKHVEYLLEPFEEITGGKYLCSEICGQHFDSLEEHTDFIANRGCKDMMVMLAHVEKEE